MNKKNISKIFMIFGISILVLAIIGSTFAYYVWTTGEEDTTKIVTGIGAATVYFDGGSDIADANLRPVSDKSKGIVKNIKVKGDTTGLVFNMYLDLITLPDALKEESFKYALYNGETLIQEGNFSSDYLTSNTSTCSTNSTTHITLLTNEAISTSNVTYTLYIWIDGANYTNPNTMMNQTFSFKLHANGENAVLGKPSAAEYITNIYTEATKTTATNNSITYNYANIYDVDDDSNTSGGLMNDRLGGTTADLDGGNIRYYGASPNNYIYFNCSDYSNQTDSTCEKWRIIGVFNGKVKIIRNESIGRYSWDNKDTTTGAETDYGKNDWTTARLMKLLNPSDYYEVDANDNGLGQSLYYTAQSGTCYSDYRNATTTCDFTSTGIKNDATKNMIEEVIWNLGGWNTAEIYSNQAYSYERGTTVYSGRPTSWKGKIALMYPSDYGYAADFTKCSQNIYNYDSVTDSNSCQTNDWLYNVVYQWLLTPRSSDSSSAWRMCSPGFIYSSYDIYYAREVRPVLYLASELSLSGGVGSSADPYRLSSS